MDNRSISGGLLTITGTILTDITKSEVLFWVTVLAGISTLAYNVISAYFKFKNNKK